MKKIKQVKVPTFNIKTNSTKELRYKSYDTAWRKFSKAYRQRNFFCEECLKDGKYNSEKLEVDHIIPLCQAPHLKFEESNLQVLCKSCHAKKTCKETLGK